VEWSLLLDRAYAHQVYPLVYRNLRQLGFSAVPPEVQTKLKGAYLANALRDQLFSDELACLLRLLSDAGFSAIPLKGVALTFDTEAVKDPNLLLLVVFIRLRREACNLGVPVAANTGVLNVSQITSSPSGVGLRVYLHSRGSQP
jgi:putative nucleotidyltransferase-like protein